MSSPLDKMPASGTPEYKQLVQEMAADYAAMALRDAARLLKEAANLAELAASEPILYEEFRNAVLSFEAEMLNEEPDHAD